MKKSIFLILIFLGVLINLNIVLGEEIRVMSATFGSPPLGLSCKEDSSSHLIYCFGGLYSNNPLNYIFEYNSIKDTLKIKKATLPTKMAYTSCAENSETHKIYCFGGYTGGAQFNKVLEYDPKNDVLNIKTTLPSGRDGPSCAENSETHKIYCFGGHSVGNYLSEIIEYDPVTNTLVVKNSKLPTGKHHSSCEEDSSSHLIYCFGGEDNSYEITEYDPKSDKLTIKKATLSPPREGLSCTEYSPGNIFCFGGNYNNDILQYNPRSDNITKRPLTFPDGRHLLSCEKNSASNKIYCFGGNPGSNKHIIEYTPPTYNQPPTLNPIGNKQINEGKELKIQLIATDPEKDPLTFAIEENLPSQYSFNTTSGLFLWTPKYKDTGNYTVTFKVTDGISWDKETINIEVINNPPVLNPIGNKQIDENKLLSIQLIAKDPEKDPLTFSIEEQLPSQYSFDIKTGLFLWTPTYKDSGKYEVTFKVTDGISWDKETITITVNHVNLPPILKLIGNKEITEGKPLQFTVEATDPDNDPITFKTDASSILRTQPSFDTKTGLFLWTPIYTDYGNYKVTFEVTDGKLSDKETITLSVKDAKTAKVAFLGLPQVGNTMTFMISDPVASHQFYVLVMAFDNNPGFPLGDGRLIPLKNDAMFFLSLMFPTEIKLKNSVGILNEKGNAIAEWQIPKTNLIANMDVHVAVVTLDMSLSSPEAFISISDPVKMKLIAA